MSLNFRKRPSNILEDNTSKKRPKLDQSPEPVSSSETNDPLTELSTRDEDTTELSEEEVSTETEEDSSSDEEILGFNYEDELENLKDEDPIIFESLVKVQEELKKTEPNVMALLKTPLRLKDRAKLCQLYEIYKSLEPNTFEWLEARKRYNTFFREYRLGFKQHTKYSKEQHAKMKEVEKELGTYDPQLSLKYKILNLVTTKANKATIYRRFEDLQALEGGSEEYSKLKHWLNWAVNIPHDKVKEIKVDNITKFIIDASKKLDQELFGMKKVKEQILLFLSAKLTNPGIKRSNLGLVGPPGVGKTAIARMIAKLMDWGFEQISFGGVNKADFLKGHEYTYIGAQPGAIVKCLRRMGHKNGVIFLDELEKAAEHLDIKAALLHLVDQSQNHEFKDNFLGDITIDLSHIWYIGSMNSIPKDKALADRWWIIEIKGYGLQDKVKITREYLFPKALKNANRTSKDIIINTRNCENLIRKVSKENDKGVRTIQKAVEDIVNKVNFLVTHQDEEGNIPFSTTFKMKKRLVFPVTLTSDILNKLITNKELNNMLHMMYL